MDWKSTDIAEDMMASEPARGDRSPIRRFAPALFIAAGLALGYAMGWQHYLSLDFLAASRAMLKEFAAVHPVLAPVGFFVLYALATGFAFPAASVLTIFGGFLFGWLFGGVLALFAATAGATGLFLASRTAFGDYLKQRAGAAASRLSQGFERDAFGYLLVLRLAPFIPFFVVNIAAGLFSVRPRIFVAATFLGIIPAVFAYTWLGQGVDSVLVAAHDAGKAVRVGDLVTPEIVTAFAALALFAAIAAVVKKVWAARAG